MKTTRGMRRRTAKLARRSEIVDRGTLVAGIDIAKKESVVVFIRAADKARVGRLRVPTTAEGVLQVTGCGRQLAAENGCERLVLAMETTGHYWKILARSAERLGVPYVTVQSFVAARAPGPGYADRHDRRTPHRRGAHRHRGRSGGCWPAHGRPRQRRQRDMEADAPRGADARQMAMSTEGDAVGLLSALLDAAEN